MSFLNSLIVGFVFVFVIVIMALLVLLVGQVFGDIPAMMLASWLFVSCWIWLFSN